MGRKIFLIWVLFFIIMTGGSVMATQSYPFMEDEGYVILLTDIHNGIADQASQELAETFANFSPLPEYIFVGGDLTEMGSRYEYTKLKNNYAPVFDLIPFGWMVGNHDARWSEHGFYLFEQELGPPYFAIDFDKFVFIGLNSATLLEQHGHFGQTQVDWLKAKLKEIGTEKPIILQAHHPFGGPSQFTDDGYKIFAAIKDYNVPLILVGHGHSYKVQGSYNHTWIQMLEAGMEKYYSPLSWDERNLYLWEAHLEKGVKLRKTIPLSKQKKEKLDWICEPTYRNQTLHIFLETENITEIKIQLNSQTKTIAINRDGIQSIQWELQKPLSGKELIQITGISSTTTMLLHAEISTKIPELSWTFSSGDSIFTQPAVDEKALYFGNQAGEFYALDKTTGELLWSYQTDAAILSSPTIVGNIVIFGSTDTNLYGLNKIDGQLIWKTNLPGVIYGGVVAGHKLIAVGTGDHYVYGLHPLTGEIIWKAFTWGMVQSSGSYSLDRFIFTSWGGVIVFLDEMTGKLVQAYPSGSGYTTPGPCTPVIFEDRLLYTNTNSKYYGQSLIDKKDTWVVNDFQVGYASVAIDDSSGYLSTLKGQVFQFDPHTGEQNWLTKVSGPIYDSSPQLFGEYLVVGTIRGDIWILRKANGQIIKQISLGNGFIFGKIRATNNMLYVGSMDGNLYAIDVTNLTK